ncbi:MAG: hypothetical protein RLO81_10385 [Fulvivirga sp.]|uniref:hypothetical protein n=1 Tax=Fulvivirga sp. TaxID=1931237 RepID=UPI0032EB54DA
MKYRLTFLKSSIIICSIIIFYSCSKNEIVELKNEKFTKLTGVISPFLEYTGRGKIDDGQNSTIYYEFNYDEKNRLKSIRYFKNSSANNNSYFGAHEVRYEYLDRTITRTYYNVEGNQSPMWRHYYLGENIFKEQFTLTENGDKESLILMDSLDNRVSTGLGSYKFLCKRTDSNLFIQHQFAADSTRNYLTHYFPFKISKITTDGAGRLYSITNLDSLGNEYEEENIGYSKVVFDFDEFGNELGWKFVNIYDSLADRKPFLNMDYGFAKVQYKFNWIDRELGLYSSFDELYFDSDNNPTNTNLGIHKVHYEINNNDDLTMMAYFDKDLKPADHPNSHFHKVLIEYDSSMQRSKATRIKSNGEVL